MIGSEAVALDGTTLRTDLDAFLAALSTGRLAEAEILWRGPFLDRLASIGSEEWERWVDERRDDLARRFAAASIQAAEELLRERRERGALEHLDRAVRVCSRDAQAHALRVETLLALGDPERAFEALKEAREALDGLPEIARLEDAAKRIGRARQADSERAEPEHCGVRTAFVGREEYLQLAMQTWRRAVTGRSGTVLLTGDAGVGRTRLLSEIELALKARGARVVDVRAFPSDGDLEWSLIADIVGRLVRLPGAAGVAASADAVLATLVPSLRRTGESRGGAAQPPAISDALIDLLGAVCDEGPLAVLLDDLHSGDPRSRSLLALLTRRIEDLPLILVATARVRHGAPQSMQTWIASARDVAHVVVRPLDRAEVREVVDETISFDDARDAQALGDEIFALTGGNPLFVGEVLSQLAEDGVLGASGGRWRLLPGRPPLAPVLPARVRAALFGRLDGLTPTGQRVCALVGNLGPVPKDALTATTGLDDAAFDEVAGELVLRGVLRWTEPGILDFVCDDLRNEARRRAEDSVYRPPPSRIAWTHAAAVAALVGLFALIGSPGAPLASAAREAEGPAPHPFGRMVVEVRSLGAGPDLDLVPPVRLGDHWDVTEPQQASPPGTSGPFLTTAGERLWFDGAETATTSVAEYRADGTSRIVWRGSRSASFSGVSPDGRWILVTIREGGERPTPLELIRVQRGDPTSWHLIARASGGGSGAHWSPDGARIAFVAHARPDTLVTITPDGARRWQFPLEGVRGLEIGSWCGDSRHLAAWMRPTEGPRVALLIDAETGTIEPLAPQVAAAGPGACVGDAAAVVFAGVEAGDEALFVVDRLQGSLIRAAPVWGPVRIRATPLVAASVPLDLEVRPSALELPRGGRRQLTATATWTDGSAEPPELAWTSSDTSVIVVDADGLVTGLRAGTAWALSSHRDWLRDSVLVTVPTGDPNPVVLHEDFRERSLARWNLEEAGDLVVTPPPMSALSLRGDEAGDAELTSRGTFGLEPGATVEAQFQLPLTPGDESQGFELCLEEVTRADRGRDACFRYPAAEAGRFDPTEGLGWADNPANSAIATMPPGFTSSDWHHVAVQVRADGVASVWLDSEHLLDVPFPMALETGATWRVRLAGAVPGTRLEVRSITAWGEPRFGWARVSPSVEWEYHTLPTLHHMDGLWGSAADKVFAVGDAGRILHFDGDRWRPTRSPTSAALLGVWGASPDAVFAVGYGGTIVHYDGASWTRQLQPWGAGGGKGDSSRGLFAVWGSAADDVFAVGGRGTVLRYDGVEWGQPMETGTTATLRAVWGSGPDDVHASSSDGTLLHYDGREWRELRNPTERGMLALWGWSPSNVIAVGVDGAILRYDGEQWGRMDSPTTETLEDVWGSTDDDIYAVGWGGTILHFDGRDWRTMETAIGDLLYDVWGVPGGNVYVSGRLMLRRTQSGS